MGRLNRIFTVGYFKSIFSQFSNQEQNASLGFVIEIGRVPVLDKKGH